MRHLRVLFVSIVLACVSVPSAIMPVDASHQVLSSGAQVCALTGLGSASTTPVGSDHYVFAQAFGRATCAGGVSGTFNYYAQNAFAGKCSTGAKLLVVIVTLPNGDEVQLFQRVLGKNGVGHGVVIGGPNRGSVAVLVMNASRNLGTCPSGRFSFQAVIAD
jgi:hypothetical protein